MPSITITREQAAYLERTARRLTDLSGRKVTKKEVLSSILETAIEDEGVYEPGTSSPIDPYRKKICQAEREARSASFAITDLLGACRSQSHG